MNLDLNPFYTRYEALVSLVGSVFEKINNECPDKVKCVEGCSDCCFALFDLTFIEALYLNHNFNKEFDGVEKLNIIDRANRADRKIHRLKKQAHKDFQNGASEVEVLGKMSVERVRCPLLNDEDRCDLYEKRPLTCRLYGIPTSSAGMSHTCGKSGFTEGEKYPTVNMDKTYQQLYQISSDLAVQMKSKYLKLGEMLVPLSMAIITEYDETYLGVEAPADKKEKKEEADE